MSNDRNSPKRHNQKWRKESIMVSVLLPVKTVDQIDKYLAGRDTTVNTAMSRSEFLRLCIKTKFDNVRRTKEAQERRRKKADDVGDEAKGGAV